MFLSLCLYLCPCLFDWKATVITCFLHNYCRIVRNTYRKYILTFTLIFGPVQINDSINIPSNYQTTLNREAEVRSGWGHCQIRGIKWVRNQFVGKNKLCVTLKQLPHHLLLLVSTFSVCSTCVRRNPQYTFFFIRIT